MFLYVSTTADICGGEDGPAEAVDEPVDVGLPHGAQESQVRILLAAQHHVDRFPVKFRGRGDEVLRAGREKRTFSEYLLRPRTTNEDGG